MKTTATDPECYRELLQEVVAAVRSAGAALLSGYPATDRPTTAAGIGMAIAANDTLAEAVLRGRLAFARPAARWIEDELDEGPLPAGEWWLVDTVEGNINLVHGTPNWGVSVTLIQENTPVLAVVGLPVVDEMYVAIRGGGASVNGQTLSVSAKTDLPIALVGSGQAKPGESHKVHRLLGDSVTAMLENALLVTVSVPSTLQLIGVASGSSDAFWQYSRVRSGLAAGALLVQEAGGMVTDTHGHPWTLASDDFLATCPGIHREAVRTLSLVGAS